ncbi:hypothetical protein [Pseudomonas petrae]|uniref:Uncharacterized protein n=1 Tax=Pseudomonas petrae TaxID=2912190 RepID=A0ABS9IDZ5_9PSED|nr:hypothetical protein [Pseudomonas petrae]MCF7545298.1 hypothetical protein [Pseudomonas petrae]
MDAKNLAVLLKLKNAMDEAKPSATKQSSASFSAESLNTLKELAKKRFENAERGSAKDAIKFVRAECRSCKAIYSLEPESYRPYWTCSACKRAKKQKQLDEAEAKRVAQYAKATGTKVQQVERAIQDIKAKIDLDDGLNRIGLLLRLNELEKKLELEKVHAISKLNSVRPRKVPGSYGSNR